MDKSAVTIRQEAYYTLEADGKPLAYFADYVDSAFLGGSINKDSIHTRSMTQRGYWVNRLPVVPSCHGRILIRWNYKPLTIVNLKGKGVLRLIRQTMTQMDSELDG
ncbi:MAG: glycosyl hydrolase family 25, partial [Prevotella sp.]|nr:glycosyl hydrolase family 25 [Prevotella sp.]